MLEYKTVLVCIKDERIVHDFLARGTVLEKIKSANRVLMLGERRKRKAFAAIIENIAKLVPNFFGDFSWVSLPLPLFTKCSARQIFTQEENCGEDRKETG